MLHSVFLTPLKMQIHEDYLGVCNTKTKKKESEKEKNTKIKQKKLEEKRIIGRKKGGRNGVGTGKGRFQYHIVKFSLLSMSLPCF